MNKPPSPIAELCRYLAGWANITRSKRQFTELLGVEVAIDISVDLRAHQRGIADAAYSAEQSDLEAATLLEAAAADGFTNADLPAVEKAIRLIRASARQDHDIADSAAVTP